MYIYLYMYTNTTGIVHCTRNFETDLHVIFVEIEL